MKRNVLIAALAAAMLSTAALAQWGPGPGTHGPGYGMGRMMQGGAGFGCGPGSYAYEALGLSAEQRERIAAILAEDAEQRLALMERMQELRLQGFRSGNPDAVALQGVRDQMFALANQRRERIDAVLTPEQRERLQSGWRGFGPRR